MDADSPDGGVPEDVKIETVHVFTSHEAANLAAANLEANGIQCWISADDGGGMLPSLSAPGGVRLSVQDSDVAGARALLFGTVPDDGVPPLGKKATDVSPRPSAFRRSIFALWMVFIGFAIGFLFSSANQWFNQRGQRTTYHHGRNGRADEARIYRDGHLVEFMKDRNRDGAWDYWVYYQNGLIAKAEYDNNFDGKPDETWTYAYGLPVSMEKDTDFNGVPDMFCAYKDGLPERVDYKPNGSKFVTVRLLYQQGILTETLRGGDARGNFKEAVHYDPFYNPISAVKSQ